MCHKPQLVRDKLLGAPASVKLVYWGAVLTHQASWRNNVMSSPLWAWRSIIFRTIPEWDLLPAPAAEVDTVIPPLRVGLRHCHFSVQALPTACCPSRKFVKVQFRGPELYKKEGALFQEESYLPRIVRSPSLNLHTFHRINIVFWWQIFFRKHGKSTPQRSARPPCFGHRRCDHDVTMQVHEELSANHTLQSMTTTCR